MAGYRILSAYVELRSFGDPPDVKRLNKLIGKTHYKDVNDKYNLKRIKSRCNRAFTISTYESASDTDDARRKRAEWFAIELNAMIADTNLKLEPFFSVPDGPSWVDNRDHVRLHAITQAQEAVFQPENGQYLQLDFVIIESNEQGLK